MSRICVFFIFFLTLHAAMGSEWQVIKYQHRDYLTLANVAEFYGLGSVRRSANHFVISDSTRSLMGTVGSAEFYINNLKFILSYPVVEEDGHLLISRMDLAKIIEPVLRPYRIRTADRISTVILDPGHGGYDNGCTSRFGYEKNYALDVALRAKPLLEAEGFRVLLTRKSDIFVPLGARVAFANRHTNAIFISIHFNSGQPLACGVETFTLAPYGVPSMSNNGPEMSDFIQYPGNACDPQNMALACAVHAVLVSHTGEPDRGIKRARFLVLRGIRIPGVLVEGGFLSNHADARRVATAQYRETLAQCIAKAAENYQKAVAPFVPPPDLSAPTPAPAGAPAAKHHPDNEPQVILHEP